MKIKVAEAIQYRVFRLLKSKGIYVSSQAQKFLFKAIRENFTKYKDMEEKRKTIYFFYKDHLEESSRLEQGISKEQEMRNCRRLKYLERVNKFYKSKEWRYLRYKVLAEQRGRCQLCGRSRKDGAILHCDHIVALSKDWSRRLDKSNIQVLCEECNLGKSNRDSIDWR